jgi:uncharacterized iron-regulated protein
VADAIRGADFVLLGEIHDNPDHHRLQAWAVEAAAERAVRPTVAWEMIDRTQTPVLVHYGGPPAGLGAALNWADSGWPAWRLYEPIAAAAMAAGLPMVGADLAPATIRAVARKGAAALGPGEWARLGLDRPLPPASAARLRDALAEGHCNLLPEKALDAMVPVQRARDATMADAMIQARDNKDRPVLLITGNGHARADFGVPRYLARRRPQARILVVSFRQVSNGDSDPAAYAGPGQADFVWFTPRARNDDPCEGLAKRLGKDRK